MSKFANLLAAAALTAVISAVPQAAAQTASDANSPSAQPAAGQQPDSSPESSGELVPDPVRLNLDVNVQNAAGAADAGRQESTLEEAKVYPVLTLAQALMEAEKNNTSLEEAKTQLAQAQLYSRKAWAGYLPTITLGASLTHNSDPTAKASVQPIMATDAVTQQMGGPYMIQVSDSPYYTKVGQNVFGAQLSLQQGLVVPQLWAAIKNTYIAERMVELTVENARREILFGVTQLYISAATLRETIDVRRRMLANTEAHEKDARYRFEAGTIPKIQLVRASIDTVNAQQQVLQAENNYVNAKLALSTLIGRDTVEFDVEKPQEVNPPEGSVDELVKVASDKRLDLLSARDNLAVAGYGMKQAKYAYLPNLFLTAAVSFGRPSYEFSDAMEQMMEAAGTTMSEGDKWSKTWNIGLALSWTIWDGGAREVSLKENQAKVAAAEAKLRGVEAKVREEVRSAIVSLQIARSNIINAKEQLRLARENSDMVNVNFNAGVATQLDVSDANTALIGAELNLIAQTLQAQISALTLVKAAGLFDPKTNENSGGVAMVSEGGGSAAEKSSVVAPAASPAAGSESTSPAAIASGESKEAAQENSGAAAAPAAE